MSYPWLDEAEQQFMRSLTDGRMAHAILVGGPGGLGKLEFANRAARTLMCLERNGMEQGFRAECHCRSCQLMGSGAHPDFRLLTFEENEKTHKMRTELVVEQVRGLSASMQLTNSLSPYKVAIVHPAEAMNRSTANALLKTLEEPPGDSVLFLVSHDPSRLPQTIRSRCQKLPVRIPDLAVARNWLVQQGVSEAASADRALLAAAGRPLTALQMTQDGRADQFQEVGKLLARASGNENAIDEIVEACARLEPTDLWTWISLIAARRVRQRFAPSTEGQKSIERPGRPPGGGSTHQLARLQMLADGNRLALSTQLRKDLLLRDWLIQWSRIATD